MFNFNRVKQGQFCLFRKTANGKRKGKRIDSFKLGQGAKRSRQNWKRSPFRIQSVKAQHGQSRWREDNIPRQHKNIRDKTVAFITGLTCHQHIVLQCISSDK